MDNAPLSLGNAQNGSVGQYQAEGSTSVGSSDDDTFWKVRLYPFLSLDIIIYYDYSLSLDIFIRRYLCVQSPVLAADMYENRWHVLPGATLSCL
jgi:hypothetical protein